ncbi:MAG: hypothetical protein SPL05_04435 [Eubacteriales bacterium]|nr:hypothetical protein [Eubacteriales bacterium]
MENIKEIVNENYEDFEKRFDEVYVIRAADGISRKSDAINYIAFFKNKKFFYILHFLAKDTETTFKDVCFFLNKAQPANKK